MSSEEFEKLHEIFKSLYDELQLIPDKALRCHGGKHGRLTRRRKNSTATQKHNALISNVVCDPAEERKKLVRTFDERHGEAEEVVSRLSSTS